MKITRKNDASLKKMFLTLEKYAHTAIKTRRLPARSKKSFDARTHMRKLAARKFRMNNKDK